VYALSLSGLPTAFYETIGKVILSTIFAEFQF